MNSGHASTDSSSNGPSSPQPIACELVDLGFFHDAPSRAFAHEIINASPSRIFDHFEDADAWPKWALPITKVVWTSSLPYTVGSTRTVHMAGGLIGDEEFLAFDRGKHMAFRFNAVSKPGIAAFAENYVVTQLDERRCLVEWTMAMRSEGLGARVSGLTTPLVAMGLRHMLRQFRKYVERHN